MVVLHRLAGHQCHKQGSEDGFGYVNLFGAPAKALVVNGSLAFDSASFFPFYSGFPGWVRPVAGGGSIGGVMNRCPKIELFRPFWKPRLNQII